MRSCEGELQIRSKTRKCQSHACFVVRQAMYDVYECCLSFDSSPCITLTPYATTSAPTSIHNQSFSPLPSPPPSQQDPKVPYSQSPPHLPCGPALNPTTAPLQHPIAPQQQQQATPLSNWRQRPGSPHPLDRHQRPHSRSH